MERDQRYLQLVFKWSWLILLAGVIGAGLSFAIRVVQPAAFTASTTLAIGNYLQTSADDGGNVRAGEDLAYYYSLLADRHSLAQATIEALKLPLSVAELNDAVQAEPLRDAPLLVVRATYSDPVIAAEIANEFANQLIIDSTISPSDEQVQQLELAQTQLDLYIEMRDAAFARMIEIDEEILTVTDPNLLGILTAQHATLIDQYSIATNSITRLEALVANLGQSSNVLRVVEPANVPVQATGISAMFVAVLGAIAGVVLSVAAIVFFEYTNDTIRSVEDLYTMIGSPVLGTIARFRKAYRSAQRELVTLRQPRSIATEGYRTVATNLLLNSSRGSSNSRTFIVSSPHRNAGKSVTAANLAVMFATSGMKTLLLDADFRRPRIHKLFEIENTAGLANLLAPENTEAHNEIDAVSQFERFSMIAQNVDIPNLQVITSGYLLSDNPSYILNPLDLQRQIGLLRKVYSADVVILDTPPCLVVADSSLIAGSLKADVILVAEAGRTRRDGLLKAREQFMYVGANIRGIVLNKLTPRGFGGGYGHKAYFNARPPAPVLSANGHSEKESTVTRAS